MPIHFIRQDNKTIDYSDERLDAYRMIMSLAQKHPSSIAHLTTSLRDNPTLPWVVKPEPNDMPAYNELSKAGMLTVRKNDLGFHQALVIVDIKDKAFLDFVLRDTQTPAKLQTEEILNDPNNKVDPLRISSNIDLEPKPCCIIS